MPAKKQRPLRKSYAGVLAPLASKKASAREMLAWVSKALALTVHELADKKEQLAAAELALDQKSQIAATRLLGNTEQKARIFVLTEQLKMKELQLYNFEGTIRALEAQNEFWQAEAQRLQDRLVLQIAEEARNRKPIAVDPPSDDLQDIEALQNHALRGGVA